MPGRRAILWAPEYERSLSEAASVARSTSCDVYDQEHNDPHGVDEMPVEGEHSGPRCVERLDVTKQREDRAERQTGEAGRHMERVQAYERKIGRPKQIGVYGQIVDVDQSVPFAGGSGKEHRPNPQLPR